MNMQTIVRSGPTILGAFAPDSIIDASAEPVVLPDGQTISHSVATPTVETNVDVPADFTVARYQWGSAGLEKTPAALAEDEAQAAAETAALEAYRSAALVRVDAEAEATRLRFLTPGTGQAMEYMETSLEVAQALAQPVDTVLDAATYPMLEAERLAQVDAGKLGAESTIRDVLSGVSQVRANWTAVAGQIKQLRRGTKMAIFAAGTQAEIDAKFPISWPQVQAAPEDL